MFLISKSVQKNTWSQYQTTVLLNTMSCDCPRNPATPGRLNHFPCYKNFCVLNKKWVGNHHSMWPTSIKPPLHFPWNGCLRKIRQHAALRTDYEERQEHSEKWHAAANATAGWDFPAPPSTFTKGYPILKSRKTSSRFEVMIPSEMKTSEILYSHKFNLLCPISDLSPCHPKQEVPFISYTPLYRVSHLFLYFLPGTLAALYSITIKNWSYAAIIFEMQLLFPQYVKQAKNKY